jgi:hypothetical protein
MELGLFKNLKKSIFGEKEILILKSKNETLHEKNSHHWIGSLLYR